MIYKNFEELNITKNLLQYTFLINMDGDSLPIINQAILDKLTLLSDPVSKTYSSTEHFFAPPIDYTKEGRVLFLNTLNRCDAYFPNTSYFIPNQFITLPTFSIKNEEYFLYYYCIIETLLTTRALQYSNTRIDVADYCSNTLQLDFSSLIHKHPINTTNTPKLLKTTFNSPNPDDTSLSRTAIQERLTTLFQKNHMDYIQSIFDINSYENTTTFPNNKKTKYTLPIHQLHSFQKIFSFNNYAFRSYNKFYTSTPNDVRTLKKHLYSIIKNSDEIYTQLSNAEEIDFIDTLLAQYQYEKYFYPSFLKVVSLSDTITNSHFTKYAHLKQENSLSLDTQLSVLKQLIKVPIPFYRERLFEEIGINSFIQQKHCHQKYHALQNEALEYTWLNKVYEFITEFTTLFLPLILKVFFTKAYDINGCNLQKLEKWCIKQISQEKSYFLKNSHFQPFFLDATAYQLTKDNFVFSNKVLAFCEQMRSFAFLPLSDNSFFSVDFTQNYLPKSKNQLSSYAFPIKEINDYGSFGSKNISARHSIACENFNPLLCSTLRDEILKLHL